MIEMVYKGKDGTGKDEKKLPKNVRQIGEAGKGKRIYLEDYAVTYLHQVEAAVLLGETWEKEGVKYIFVHGAIQVEDTSFEGDIWENVYRDAREYFPDSEILGWGMQASEQPDASDKKINQIFKTHFDRADTVLLVYEPSEKEDTIFAEENGVLKKAGGYYVYYDKNKSMQEYMIRKNEGKSVEKEQAVTDKAIKNFRKMSEEKKDRQGKEKETAKQPKNVRFLYVASTFLVLTIMVIAVTMISNYDKMKNMEMALSNIVKSTEPSLAANAAAKEEAAYNTADVFAEESENAVVNSKASGTEQGAEKETAGSDGQSMNGTEAGEPGSALSSAEAQGAAALPDTDTLSEKGAALMSTGAGTDKETKDSDAGSSTEPSDGGETADAQTREASAGGREMQAFYTVKDGDTLMDICRMYYGTDEKLDALCEFNNITDPNSIVPGQKIKLP